MVGGSAVNVCIVTVYNSINSGSYWQAYALRCFLKSIGCNVFFYKRPASPGSSASTSFKIKKIAKAVLKAEFKRAVRIKQIYDEFYECQKIFNTVEYPDLNTIDLVILGSDTIWNISDSYFANNICLFWGKLFEGKNVISYAGSIANTPIDKIMLHPEIPRIVAKWDKISVRDKWTFNAFENITTKEIIKVCDPTFLLDKADYLKMVSKPKEPPYIFLYLFDDLNLQQVSELINFAKDKRLKIISGIDRDKISDKVIINAPKSFLQYMSFAEYVITDTFHGAAFSINLEKQFVVVDRNKNKVNELLEQVQLEDRVLRIDKELKDILNETIDYERCRTMLQKIKIVSKKFLMNEVERIKNDNTEKC